MTTNKKVVGVVLEFSTKVYSFLNTDDTIEVGDTVVCDTSNGLKIGKVHSFILSGNRSYRAATRYIVQKVNLADHYLRIEKQKRAKEIDRQLEQKKQQFVDSRLLDLMLLEDPELYKLVNERKALEEEV